MVEAGQEISNGSKRGEVEGGPLSRPGASPAVAERHRALRRYSMQDSGLGSPLSGPAERGCACGKLPTARIRPQTRRAPDA